MKNLLLLLLFQTLLYGSNLSQIECIRCYEQNDPISPEANNLIRNGGFENTDCTPGWLSGSYCPKSNLYDCDIDDWTCTGGGELSYPIIFDSTLCLIPEGRYAAYFGNGNAFVCIDLMFDTSCLVRDQCTVSGFPAGLPTTLDGYGGPGGVSLEQNITGLTAGETYVLEFWAGGEPLQGLLLTDGVFAVDVGFGKTYLTCHPTEHNTLQTGTVYLVQFTATNLSHTIRFTNWGHMCSDCTELVIDNVRLYTLAELSPSVEDCMTGLTAWTEVDPVVFPNPAQDMIQMNGLEDEYVSARIISLEGKTIRKIPMQSQIDVSFLETGVYLLLLETGDSRMIRKIVKM